MNIADTYTNGPQDTPAISLAKSLENITRYSFHSFMLKWLNRCRSEIGKLRSSVDDKLGRDRQTEAALSRINVDDIATLDEDISSILEPFHVRSSVSIRAPPSDLFIVRGWRRSRDASRGDCARCERTYKRSAGRRCRETEEEAREDYHRWLDISPT